MNLIFFIEIYPKFSLKYFYNLYLYISEILVTIEQDTSI